MTRKSKENTEITLHEMQPGVMLDCLIPIAQVAAEKNVSIRTVRNWISSGLVVAYKRNNHAIFVDPRSLDTLLTRIDGRVR